MCIHINLKFVLAIIRRILIFNEFVILVRTLYCLCLEILNLHSSNLLVVFDVRASPSYRCWRCHHIFTGSLSCMFCERLVFCDDEVVLAFWHDDFKKYVWFLGIWIGDE